MKERHDLCIIVEMKGGYELTINDKEECWEFPRRVGMGMSNACDAP